MQGRAGLGASGGRTADVARRGTQTGWTFTRMSRTIAVTGGSGKLGQGCIDALRDDGWTPFNFDFVPPRKRTCSFTRLDLTDYGQAKLLNIHNLVWASSETLLGHPFNRPAAYVPLDDDVPRTPEVAYSLVKDLDEEMAVQLCRWDPEQKMIGLRFSNVMDPADAGGAWRDRVGERVVERAVLGRAGAVARTRCRGG
jgi:nucleoside-diphosphate-sugar epimerase